MNGLNEFEDKLYSFFIFVFFFLSVGIKALVMLCSGTAFIFSSVKAGHI